MMGSGFAYSGHITIDGALKALVVVIGLGAIVGTIWFAAGSYQPMQTRPIDNALVEQLSTLNQGDLIEDLNVHRVFYVRHVITSGPDLQLVEWAGNRPYTIQVEVLARRPEIIKIIRMTDPEWPEYARRFARQ